MPRLTPQHYRTLVRVFEKEGFSIVRQEGSHIVMTKPGIIRPLVIPTYKNVGEDIIMSLLRSAKMPRDRFISLLKK